MTYTTENELQYRGINRTNLYWIRWDWTRCFDTN